MEYVSKEEFDKVVAEFDARVAGRERRDALRAEWRKNGCRMTLAKKLAALKAAKEGV